MPWRVVSRGFLLIIILLVIGTIFYSAVENLSFVDAFYFSGVTITTLGYGDIVPVTTVGKIFTIIYALTGIGTVFYVLGKIFHIILTKTMLDPLFHESHQLYYKKLLAKQKISRKKTTKRRKK